MSIATLKRKSEARYQSMSVNRRQFSVEGGYRSQGFVGQNLISRHFSRSNNGQISLEDPARIKASVPASSPTLALKLALCAAHPVTKSTVSVPSQTDYLAARCVASCITTATAAAPATLMLSGKPNVVGDAIGASDYEAYLAALKCRCVASAP